jgi:putative transposase
VLQYNKEMRNIIIAPSEHYHIFNRGVTKQVIFHDTKDYYRFLFLILYFQSPIVFKNINELIPQFMQHRVLQKLALEIIKKRTVELVAFCLMPNHFHLILKESEEGGISAYMQRVLNAYSKYYNTKYQKSGHVFQGPYRAVHVEDNEQLLHLSAYIHRNPREMVKWLNKEDQYQWSSCSDFVKENRWGNLLVPEIILEQFENREEYRKFMKTSTAKLLDGELEYLKSR